MTSKKLTREIMDYISGLGIVCDVSEIDGIEFIDCRFNLNGKASRLCILPCGIGSLSPESAAEDLDKRMSAAEKILTMTGCRPVTIAEDRWKSQTDLYKARLAVHLGQYERLFARNCSCRAVSKEEADCFMEKYHNYGTAKCRHRYGLFDSTGDLVAVGTFSNARRWLKGGKTVLSYEWVRYAAADGIRIPGGMGKVLKTFIKEVSPDDIMTYSDSEWSGGESYLSLGFVQDGEKAPVLFAVDPLTWKRTPVKRLHSSADKMSIHSGDHTLNYDDNTLSKNEMDLNIDKNTLNNDDYTLRKNETDLNLDKNSQPEDRTVLYYMNCGSRKFRLKLTDYIEST